MALNRTSGVFSAVMFHPTVYDTGRGKSNKPYIEEDYQRRRLLKEDEEILVFLIAINNEEV